MENFASVPALVVITYLAAEGIKLVKNGEFTRFIPVFCGIFGGILGMLCFIFCPEYIMAENIFSAFAVGIVSGFSATGVNQIYKQLKKDETK